MTNGINGRNGHHMPMPTGTQQVPTVLSTRPRADFVETETVKQLTERGLMYLNAGYPIHLRGPAGTGKTTLALHVAAQLGRPIMLMSGDEEVTSSDMIGGQNGYRYRKVVDRFIQTVLKYEEDAVQRWVDNRLTIACRQGFTLVYDEFTRSRPEANNALLSVLEEGILIMSTVQGNESYIKVHPEFRAIFTSNPREYAGVHHTQDALSDRMITIDLDFYDRDTEVNITMARAGLSEKEAASIVDMVRDYRDSGDYEQMPTLRACLMIARVAGMNGITASVQDERFVTVCLDVLEAKSRYTGYDPSRRKRQRDTLVKLIKKHCE